MWKFQSRFQVQLTSQTSAPFWECSEIWTFCKGFTLVYSILCLRILYMMTIMNEVSPCNGEIPSLLGCLSDTVLIYINLLLKYAALLFIFNDFLIFHVYFTKGIYSIFTAPNSVSLAVRLGNDIMMWLTRTACLILCVVQNIDFRHLFGISAFITLSASVQHIHVISCMYWCTHSLN